VNDFPAGKELFKPSASPAGLQGRKNTSRRGMNAGSPPSCTAAFGRHAPRRVVDFGATTQLPARFFFTRVHIRGMREKGQPEKRKELMHPL